MKEIETILNKIGVFCLNTGEKCIELRGMLKDINGTIYFTSEEADCKSGIKDRKEYQIWGKVGCEEVTLLRSLTRISYRYCGDKVIESISAEPTEIIIGKCYEDKIHVKEMSTCINELNWMFSLPAFKEHFDFTHDEPAVLDYTFPKRITAVDRYGEITLSQSLKFSRDKEKYVYKTLPIVGYQFIDNPEIDVARARIAAARNLFSFLADRYIPLEALEFTDIEATDNATKHSHTLWLNVKEDIKSEEGPFLVTTEVLSNNFQRIWKQWLRFYETHKHIPSIYYEIVCGRSTDVNRFLNLTQMIEYLSRCYREKEARELAAKEERAKNSKGNLAKIKSNVMACLNDCEEINLPDRKELADAISKRILEANNKEVNPLLRHRIEDILHGIKEYIDIDDMLIEKLSHILSQGRNSYTHYNTNAKGYRELSFQELCSANRLLRYAILTMVYKTIGIPEEIIKNCAKRSIYTELNFDIAALVDEE